MSEDVSYTTTISSGEKNNAVAASGNATALSDIKVLVSHLGAYRSDFIKSGLCVFAESVLEIFIPFLMARIVDDGIMRANLQTVLVNGIAMVAFALLGSCRHGAWCAPS